MYQAAAKAAKIGVDVYAAGEAAKAKQRMDIRNAKIATEKRTTAFNRETQVFQQNMQVLKDNNTADNFNISVAEASSRDNLLMSTAGSGIAGASVDEISNEISREVGRDRVAAKRKLTASQDAANQQRIQSNENRTVEATNAYVHDYTEDIMAALYQSVGESLSM